MLKREEDEIDGLHVIVVQFPAMYGFSLLARLAKTLGPVMGALGALSADTDLATAGPALRDALANLEPDEAQRLALDILKSTSVIVPDGHKLELTDRTKIDEVFSGRLKTMFKVIAFAIKVNFSDFAAGSGAMASVAPILQARNAS